MDLQKLLQYEGMERQSEGLTRQNEAGREILEIIATKIEEGMPRTEALDLMVSLLGYLIAKMAVDPAAQYRITLMVVTQLLEASKITGAMIDERAEEYKKAGLI